MTEYKYLRWYMENGELQCDPHETLVDAVKEAEWSYMGEYDYVNERGIEGPNGAVSKGEYQAALDEWRQAERLRQATRPKPEPKVVRLSVLAPEGVSVASETWALYDEFTARQIQSGWAERDLLVGLVGEERVRWEDIE